MALLGFHYGTRLSIIPPSHLLTHSPPSTVSLCFHQVSVSSTCHPLAWIQTGLIQDCPCVPSVAPISPGLATGWTGQAIKAYSGNQYVYPSQVQPSHQSIEAHSQYCYLKEKPCFCSCSWCHYFHHLSYYINQSSWPHNLDYGSMKIIYCRTVQISLT